METISLLRDQGVFDNTTQGIEGGILFYFIFYFIFYESHYFYEASYFSSL